MDRLLINELREGPARIKGFVTNKRSMGGVTFLDVRDRTGIIQLSSEGNILNEVEKHSFVEVVGKAVKDDRARMGIEIQPEEVSTLSHSRGQYPVSIKPKAQESLDVRLKNRTTSLRNQGVLEPFPVQSTIASAFSEYLASQGFTQIFSPKIVSMGAEGGSNLFRLDYFGRDAFLAQSPQFYKQIMTGTPLERVFEIGPVFRAEKHSTGRHLNEYVSLDFEMAFIDSFHDVMSIEQEVIKFIIEKLQKKHGNLFRQKGIELPDASTIPRYKLDDMKELLASEYGKEPVRETDIDPETERLAGRYVKEHDGADFVFLTHYPRKFRPFYTMPSQNPEETESFDLLLHGTEVTTGGQRIHDYDLLLHSANEFGVNIESCSDYLDTFKYGMPPHGGLGLGLERLTAQIMGLSNIREASIFPRDRNRIKP